MIDNTRLYKYSNKLKNANNIIAVNFILNKAHDVFKGHFPDYPIVPGVLEMKLIEDILFEALSLKGELKSASNVKFLTPMFPDDNLEFECEIQYQIKEEFILECYSNIKRGDIIYANINCCFEFLIIDETK